jgi:CRISPR-associated endoribonuclease Cas6
MRLHLKLTGTTDDVPFDHLDALRSRLHAWLGADNDLHDGLSLYSFGWLRGGTAQGGALRFPRGATWRLSFHDPAAAKACLAGVLRDPEVIGGMRVFEVKEQAAPAFSGSYRFEVDAPVVTRTTRDDGSRRYLLYDDEAATDTLTRTLRTKLAAAGYAGEALAATVQFDRTYRGARTKLATLRKGGHAVKHKGSICPVVVTGPPEAVRFAWLVGVGELTGSGFGALK